MADWLSTLPGDDECPDCGKAPDEQCSKCEEATTGPLTKIEGGFRVKETPTHYVDVLLQLFNWRVALTPKRLPETIDRAFCYAGTGPDTLVKAIWAAQQWDGTLDTEPEGWNKNVQTGEWRPPAGDHDG